MNKSVLTSVNFKPGIKTPRAGFEHPSGASEVGFSEGYSRKTLLCKKPSDKGLVISLGAAR